MSKLPDFNSLFLNQLARALEARRKSLGHRGKLTWSTKQPDDFEWLTVNFAPLIGHYCIFQFVQDNRSYVYVRSRNRVNRGKLLFAMENFALVNNGAGIVEAMETTIADSGKLQSDFSHAAVEAIRFAWARVQIRIATDLA